MIEKKFLTAAFFILLASGFSSQAETLKGLRGSYDIDESSPPPEIKHLHDSSPIKRQFDYQPPLIPHTTKGYVINLKFNKCLTCHSSENSLISAAPATPYSHFLDREGRNFKKVAARRYFCVQCHVPQADTAELIENTFKPATIKGEE